MTLKDLQLRIIKHRLDAFLVTRNNMFIGQDILDEENPLISLVGFTGSAGELLVFHDKTILFVDGRYEIQAKQEVPSNVEVIVGNKAYHRKMMEKSLEDGMTIGINFWNISIKDFERLSSIREGSINFVDAPEVFPQNLSNKKSLVFEHTLEFSGMEREEKIAAFLKQLSPLKREERTTSFLRRNCPDQIAYFTSAADSVSWLLNIRSNCLPTTPIVRAMALVKDSGEVIIFGDNLDYQLNFEDNIKLMPLSAIEKEFSKLKKQDMRFCFYQTPQKIKTLADKYKISYQSAIDPAQVLKAEKNPIEIANTKTAHLRDGIVLSKFLCWLDSHSIGLTELDIVNNLFEFRKIQENFFSNSFDTIAGSGSNGAIVHYRPTKETNKTLENGSLLLLDSGAQYLDGTTDVTRTVAIGTPTQEMIDNATIVLKSHIALSSTVFPLQTAGQSLDIIARRYLWKNDKDYAHGTGHGVGFFLNVHEGPISISPRGTQYGFRENMITSIEPGFYKEGEYGIRIENLVYTKLHNEEFLTFVPLTLVPIDKKLINQNMLSNEEKTWLNNYHQKVYSKLEPYMDEAEKSWLSSACSPL